MSSIESVIFQLSYSYISETSILTSYLYYPEVILAIQKYNWSVGRLDNQGWVILFKNINYSS
jgi:hypothetical protein